MNQQRQLFEEDPLDGRSGGEIMQYLQARGIMTLEELRSFWRNFDASGETGEHSGGGTWHRTIVDFLESADGRESLKQILSVMHTIDGQRQMSYYKAMRLLWSSHRPLHL